MTERKTYTCLVCGGPIRKRWLGEIPVGELGRPYYEHIDPDENRDEAADREHMPVRDRAAEPKPRCLGHATIEGDTGRIGLVRCTLDADHYPETSHEYVIAWRDDDTGEETEPYDPDEPFDVEVPMPKRKPFTFRPDRIDEVAHDRLGDDAA